MPELSFAGARDVEVIGDACLSVLERVGMCFQNGEILTALEEWGAGVERASCVATFPRRKLSAFVDEIRQEAAYSPPRAALPFRSPPLPAVTGSVAQFVYDHRKQEARRGRREDLVAAVKLGASLHPDSPIGHAVLVSDAPALVEPLEAALVLAEHAPIPAAPFAWNVRHIPYLLEMGSILGLDDWYSLGAVCMAHPLRFDQNVADRYVHMMRHEHRPAGLTAMPVPGVSAPVTLEGFLAVTGAEFLASWVAGRALNPRIPLGGSMWVGTSDMRAGHVSYSAFDAMFYAISTFEFLRRWCGVTVSVGGGEYCSSRVPGLYAALEKVCKALTIAAFTGECPTIGEGMLDNGKVLSFVQLRLERDVGSGLNQFARQAAATSENLALDAILEVGLSGDGHVVTEHTARHFRESLWLPSFVPRDGWTGAENEARLLARCQTEVDRLIAQAKPPEGREEQLAAMRAIVERARRELLY